MIRTFLTVGFIASIYLAAWFAGWNIVGWPAHWKLAVALAAYGFGGMTLLIWCGASLSSQPPTKEQKS